MVEHSWGINNQCRSKVESTSRYAAYSIIRYNMAKWDIKPEEKSWPTSRAASMCLARASAAASVALLTYPLSTVAKRVMVYEAYDGIPIGR